jgi:hypothetical protein
MERVDQLIEQAKESAEWRGHDLSDFTKLGEGRYIAGCKNCNATALVIDDRVLAPNEINISGRAVAVTCDKEDEAVGELLRVLRKHFGKGEVPNEI